MSQASRFAAARRRAAWAIATMSVAVAAACSSSSSRPGILSDCTARADAACTPPATGGGGNSGPGDGGGSPVTDGEVVDAGACGSAPALLNAANAQCAVCIAGGITAIAGCCGASAACVGACLSLVQCPAGSILSCEAQFPSGIAAYNDLAACIAQDCSTQCPTLPITSGDP